MKHLVSLLFVLCCTYVAQAQKVNQQISFTALANKIYGDAPFDLIATSTSGLPVSFTSSNSLIASISGTKVTIKNAGTIEIIASQAGDNSYNAATDVKQILVISKADQVITFQQLPSMAFGDPQILMTASATSGLPITFTSSDTNVAAINGSLLFTMGAGECLISATQSGNINYNPATVSQTLLVNKANQVIVFSSLSNKTYGNPSFTLNAYSYSGLPITYESSDPSIVSILGNQVTIEGAGSVVITASQPGDKNYLAAMNVTQTLTINKATQSINFITIGSKTYGDLPFNLIAAASSNLQVTFISQYDSIATIEGNMLSIIGAGTVVITALQGGDKNYHPQLVEQILIIKKATQYITFSPIASKKFGDSPFGVTASASSGLPVTFSSGRKPIARVTGNKVTIVGAGTASIIASQSGNSNYLAAPDIIQTFPVTALGNTYPLVGATRSGGNGRGTIFSVNTNGSDHVIQTNFKANANNSPQSGLIKTTNGKLAGTIMAGGTPANGVVFSMNADGTGYSVVHNFQFTDGQRPFGNMVEGSNGVLYGMTFDGGAFNSGIVFKVNKDGSGFSALREFQGTQGLHPLGGLIQASDGDLYGMTKEGGAFGVGNLFKIKPDGSGFTILLEFDGATKGSYPRGDLIQGADQYLYGLTSNGGSSNKGILFKVKTDGTNYTKLVDFDGPSKGSNPGANLIKGSNGKLVGLTQSGGTNDKGTIFSVNADGTGFVKLFDFNGTNSGGNSVSSLVQSISDNYLYGMANQGGSSNLGTVFKIKIDGTGFTKLLDFNGANGANPVFGPLLEAQPGIFFGMTSLGGASNTGVVFSITSNGTYSLVKEFPQPEGTPEVLTPDLSGDSYVGVGSSGGPLGNGAIFKTTNNGSLYEKLADIGGNFVFVNKLITATDGGIWGIGREGVFTFNYFLFRYNTDGTGFQRIVEFDNNATKGSSPTNLLEIPGGMIYGATNTGGTFNSGIIFKIKIDGTGFTKVADVPGGTGGSRPIGNLLFTGQGEIIGMTHEGGTNNDGTIFKLNAGGQYAKVFDLLSTTSGSSPKKIIELNDGSLCVITAGGGVNNAGSSFTISNDGADYNKVRDFAMDTGIIPLDLIQSVDGYLIGTTESGGQYNQGLLYQMLTDGSDFKKILEFNGTNGSAPNNLFFKKTEQIISFDAIAKKQYNDPPFNLAASCSSGLPIVFESSDKNIVSITGNEVIIKGVGQVTITARVSGNTNFLPVRMERILVIDKDDQMILFEPLSDRLVTGSSFNLNAKSSSGLPVSFTSGSNHISITGNQVSILSAGNVTIDAIQSGDSFYQTAPIISNSFCINPTKPVITISGNALNTVLTSSAAAGNQWYKNGSLLPGQTNVNLAISEDGVYRVIATLEGCSSEPSDETAKIITAVNEIRNTFASVYPNPATQDIGVDLSSFDIQHDVLVEIVDTKGLMLYSTQHKAMQFQLNVEHLAKGVYIFKVSQLEKVNYMRLVKE